MQHPPPSFWIQNILNWRNLIFFFYFSCTISRKCVKLAQILNLQEVLQNAMIILTPVDTQQITDTLRYMPEGRGSILDKFVGTFIDFILPSALRSWDRLDRQPNHFHVPMFQNFRQPQPPGLLLACPGLCRESFTFCL